MLSAFSFAQSTLLVKDVATNLPLSNVSISCNDKIIGKTDKSGEFSFKKKCNNLEISNPGYYPETILFKDKMIVNLSKIDSKLAGIKTVILEDKSDPKAIALLKKVSDNFKNNSPQSLDSYTFKSYEKFSMDIDEDSLDVYNQTLKNQENKVKTLPKNYKKSADTATDFSNVISTSKLFLWERAQEYLYSKKYGEKINVLDTKVSGLSKPIYEMMAVQNNRGKMPKEIRLENRELYRYYLTDSLIVDGRSTYKISFREVITKSNTAKNKFSGFMYIDKETYGIKQISNFRKIATEGSISSEWKLIDGKWFLDNENVRMKFGSIDLDSENPEEKNKKKDSKTTPKKPKSEDEFLLYGFVKSKYFDVKTNVPQDSKDFKGYTYSIKNSDGSLLENYRTEELTERETGTYTAIDSLGKKYGIERKAAIFSGLLHGKLRYGMVNFDLSTVIGYNQYEGLRLGIRAKLNEKFNKYISPDAYVAYGFKDGDFKYGAGLDLKTSLDRVSFFRVEYFNDVKTAGRFSENFWQFGMKIANAGVALKNDKFYNFQGGTFSFERDLTNSLSTKLAATLQKEEALFNYNYKNKGNQFDNFNLKFSLMYAPFSKNIMTPDGKYTTESKLPDLFLNVEQGVESLGGEFSYTKIDVLINHQFKTKFGVTSNRLYAGKLFGNAPIWHHFTMNGLGGNGALNVNLASYLGFATMKGGLYYNDEFAGQYFAHQIPWHFRTGGKSVSSFSVLHRSIIGNMKNTEDHQFEFKKLDHLYQEVGLEWSNFLSSKFNLGFFYRVGYYNTPKFFDNFGVQLKYKVLGF